MQMTPEWQARAPHPRLRVQRATVLVAAFCGLSLTSCIGRELELVSDPPGASIAINGRPIGTTPKTHWQTWNKDLLKGTTETHEITFTADGYAPCTVPLSYTQIESEIRRALVGKTRVEAKLVPLGEAVTVTIVTDPPDAQVAVSGGPTVVVPAGGTQVTLPFSRANAESPYRPVTLTATKAEHEQATVAVSRDWAVSNPRVQLVLPRLSRSIVVRIESDPSGAAVLLDGRPLPGRTPLEVPVTFSRPNGQSSWPPVAATIQLADHETIQRTLTPSLLAEGGTLRVSLNRLLDRVPMMVETEPAGASVFASGTRLGPSPAETEVVFQRPNSEAAWPPLTLRAELERHRPAEATITYEALKAAGGVVRLSLDRILYADVDVARIAVGGTTSPRIVMERREAYLGDIAGSAMTGAAAQAMAKPLLSAAQARIHDSALATDPTGRLLFTELNPASGRSRLFMADGAGLRSVTDAGYLDFDPALSKDGRYCYFASTRTGKGRIGIWRTEPGRRSGVADITGRGTSLADVEPSVSPDGEWLAYTSYPDAQTGPFITIAKADGSGSERRLQAGRHPAFSPDGKLIAYVAPDARGYLQIWTIGAEAGEPPTMRTASEANHVNPCWTPDGLAIVFASDRATTPRGDRQFDLFVQTLATGELRQLTNDPSYDGRPTVSHDGSEVIFLSNRGSSDASAPPLGIYSVPLKP